MKITRPTLRGFGLSVLLLIASATYGQKEVVRVTPSDVEARPVNAPQKTVLRFIDGVSISVDDAWESEQGIWYRRSGMSHLVARERVKTIERNPRLNQTDKHPSSTNVAADPTSLRPESAIDQPVWIYLVGGARVEADSAMESAEGVWYRRGSLSVFVDRSRVDHVEREAQAESHSPASRERGWTTGNKHLDALIRQNGMKYGVDPYLIFCVMEQESHFNAHALSPKGARGLMQLMPGTAARFGVTRPSDPAQNIAGGTRYLKQLIGQFDGRVDLVLASYNAGEGAVLKFGRKVPPYRETRDYVRKISYRYRRNRSSVFSKGELAQAVRAGT